MFKGKIIIANVLLAYVTFFYRCCAAKNGLCLKLSLSKEKSAALLTAISASLGYGGWAVYANYEHGTHAWLMAGLVQATYAFFSTFFITYVAQCTFVKYDCGIRGVFAGFLASFVLMLAIPLTVHGFVGTPNIWQTILPGLIWGSIYLLGVLVSLHVSQKKQVKS